MQSGGAQRLHGQEIAEQRAVRDIDGKGPAGDIGAPRPIVTLQHLRRARVFARHQSLPARCRRYRRHRAVPCSGPARRSAVSHARPRRPARCGLWRIAWAVRSQAETDGVPARPGGGREWNAIAVPRPRTVRHRSAPSAARLPSAPQPTPRCSGRRAAARIRTDPAGCETRSRYSDAAANGRR